MTFKQDDEKQPRMAKIQSPEVKGLLSLMTELVKRENSRWSVVLSGVIQHLRRAIFALGQIVKRLDQLSS